MQDTHDTAQAAQRLAEQVRDGMLARDRAAQGLGLRITEIAPGMACLEMAVRDDMLNGFDICHGGFITALADTAFAYACNARNEMRWPRA
jgi:acyl-CoA thioesterase